MYTRVEACISLNGCCPLTHSAALFISTALKQIAHLERSSQFPIHLKIKTLVTCRVKQNGTQRCISDSSMLSDAIHASPSLLINHNSQPWARQRCVTFQGKSQTQSEMVLINKLIAVYRLSHHQQHLSPFDTLPDKKNLLFSWNLKRI